jgi:hypothetical protein
MIVYERTYFGDLGGKALDNGKLFIGQANKDPEVFPVSCFWDADLTVPAAQPLSISSGYVINGGIRAAIYTQAPSYSLRVRDRNGAQIDYVAKTGSPNPIGSFASLSTANVEGDLIQTSGSTRGTLIADSTLTDADVAAHPLAIVKTANGRYFRRDPRDIRVVMFGADNTSKSGAYDASRDSYAAIMAAIRYAQRYRYNAQGSLSGLPDVIFDDGAYSISQDIIHDDGTIRFTGRGAGQFAAPRALLFFPPSKGGFQFYKSGDTRNPLRTPAGSGTTGADGSSIIGLAIQGGNGTGNDSTGAHDGVFFGCRGHVDLCLIYGFARYQLAFIADASSQRGNANGWSVGHVRLANPNVANGGKCFATSGGDTNGGHAELLECVNGDVTEGSFLGASSYGTIQLAGGKFTGEGSANQSTVDCLYVEGGGGVSDWSDTGIWVENVQAADGVKSGSGFAIMNAGVRRYRVPVEVRSVAANERAITSVFAPDAGAGFIRNLFDSADTSPVPFQFQEIIGGGALRIAFNQAAIAYITGLSPTEAIGQFGTGVPQARVFAVGTLAKFNLSGTTARREWADSACPTSGTFAAGDFVRNTGGTPASGKRLFGWHRETTGSNHVLGTDWTPLYATTS